MPVSILAFSDSKSTNRRAQPSTHVVDQPFSYSKSSRHVCTGVVKQTADQSSTVVVKETAQPRRRFCTRDTQPRRRFCTAVTQRPPSSLLQFCPGGHGGIWTIRDYLEELKT
nr:hypothetical protein Iba_chr05bCG6860 [Ipomoea batatas]